MADRFETIKFEIKKRVAWITLNRPEVRNAFNNVMISEISSLFKEINERDDLRVVVLTGEGTVFCAGADLKWMGDVLNYTYEENYEDPVPFPPSPGLTVPPSAAVAGWWRCAIS
jgi:methylglutaconyl-CoA hydratase